MDKVRVMNGEYEHHTHVHPDDLARAIRREMAAEIEIIRDDLRKGIDVDDALRWSHDRLTAPAPREPAQERQDDEPTPKDDGAAFYAAQLRKHADSATINDFVRVDLGAARKIADALDSLATAQPAGGADPLLPGLRYVRQNMPLLGNSVGKVAQCAEQWLDAEIARREGGWQPWQPTHRHYKGGLYRVLMEGTYEASGGRCVIYQGQDGRVWVRMQDAFIENVVHEGVTQPRFAEIAQREGA